MVSKVHGSKGSDGGAGLTRCRNCGLYAAYTQKAAGTRPAGAAAYHAGQGVLDRVPDPHPDIDYVARFTTPEFTFLDPITGQPDFVHLAIDYAPGKWLLVEVMVPDFLAGNTLLDRPFAVALLLAKLNSFTSPRLEKADQVTMAGTCFKWVAASARVPPVLRGSTRGIRALKSPESPQAGPADAGPFVVARASSADRQSLTARWIWSPWSISVPMSKLCLLPLS